ncbi:tyrosine-type recombinase/integrase [Salinicola rhizosphaerae]|uniref:tyrosine-type recombinase/integrase n=1 Tax=Salinicola rhizosphaerae TaxID=1443141 RepID=UPI00167BD1A7|nr:site-specific integrase [Salinicola rhizosphaerae]
MNDVSFMELLSRYCADTHLKPKSVDSYTSAVRALRRHFGKEIYPSMLCRERVCAWRKSILRSKENPKGIVEVSWNNYARHLAALYNFGIKYQLVMMSENPFNKVRVREPRKPKKVIKPLTMRYVREVMDVCRRFEEAQDDPSKVHPAWFWEVVVETFYYTGIRLNQLLHVKAKDVDLKRMIIITSAEGSKTNSESVVPIADGLYPFIARMMLAAHRAGFKREDQLFNVNRFSRRHRRGETDINQIEHFFKKLSAFCGARVTPHRFRHTLGTELMEHPDRNLRVTQMILDHTSIRTTMEYIHPSVDSMRQALNQRRSF